MLSYCVYDSQLNHLRDVEAESDEQAIALHVKGDVFLIFRDDDSIGSRVTVWKRGE